MEGWTQEVEGVVDGVAFAWMTRANSGLLIQVLSTLPLFLPANSAAMVKRQLALSPMHIALNLTEFTSEERKTI